MDSLNILGRPWTVSWDPALDDRDCFGLCEYDKARITLLPGMDSHLDRSTLLHEVFHAILRQCGRLYGNKVEEEYVDALSQGMVSVLDANPHLKEYLCSPS